MQRPASARSNAPEQGLPNVPRARHHRALPRLLALGVLAVGVLALGVLALGVPALAPVAAYAQQKPSPASCATPEYRQFDFWLGEWEVRGPKGGVAGTSRITAILGGCALHEEWSGTGGSNGQSFNIYDAQSRRWHQTWVDNSGLLAQFDGGLSAAGAMIMEGPGRGPKGEPARSRMTFTPLPDGAVRQLWEFSTDNGTTWHTSFDGTYRRRQ